MTNEANVAPPWDIQTGEAIGADWLREEVAPASHFGRRARRRYFRRGEETCAGRESARVSEVAHAVEESCLGEVQAALAALADPTAAFARAALGAVLDDVDLATVANFLAGVEALARLLTHAAFDGITPNPHAALQSLFATGQKTIGAFYLDDAFSPELARARVERDAAQAAFDSARSTLSARVATSLGLDRLRDGEFVLLRDRLPGPLPEEIRILREAPTYVLCELAFDVATLAAQSRRDLAAARVGEAEESVRTMLSRRIAEEAQALRQTCEGLARLDILVAGARFAKRHRCVAPVLVDLPKLCFTQARYLPLEQALSARGRAYVPIDLDVSGIAVLTGPNMGGKTAALRTAGFLIACASHGLPVPAQNACIPLVDELTWVGSGQRTNCATERLLSSFAAEIVAVRALLERKSSAAVLVDEFAGTTSPREGRALLIALLGRLKAQGAVALAATHFWNVAQPADASHYATGTLRAPLVQGAAFDLDATLQRVAESIDYRIRRVTADAPGESSALAVAAALGLDTDFLMRARESL